MDKWKYYLLAIAMVLGILYALPNLYGEDPAVQISGLKGEQITEATVQRVQDLLKDPALKPKSLRIESSGALLLRFADAAAQLRAKELIHQGLGEKFSVALNLAALTPKWLEAIGAKPMKLGLDLRGGVHFLMEVDVNSVFARRMEGYVSEIPKLLREEKIPYTQLRAMGTEKFLLSFNAIEARNKAYTFLQKRDPDLALRTVDESGVFFLEGSLAVNTLSNIRNETLEQTLSTLRNRINALGVAEALVQRQGLNRVVVELPGIQDTAYARDILGTTATLKFLMEDSQHSAEDVLAGHFVPGSKLYLDRLRRPALLKNQAILTGEAIIGASTGQDRDSGPAVNVRLGGDIGLFSKTTRDNIGHRMAVVYIEVKDGKTTESLISLATIQSALGNHFQITGLSMQEARDLSLLLRSGALPAPVSIVEESIVGPSMGKDNIRMGVISVGVGLGLVLLFMGLYYSVFGMIANVALVANLILLLALMSLLGATLTLAGIAGIVLTLGMAVDANVLIFERIREELRLGLSPKASIVRGFEYAFATILDSNLTTLIVGIVLFSVGTGAIKGFAVTLCIGILTSLFTATLGSRALVELFYKGSAIRRIRVGV